MPVITEKIPVHTMRDKRNARRLRPKIWQDVALRCGRKSYDLMCKVCRGKSDCDDTSSYTGIFLNTSTYEYTDYKYNTKGI